MKKRKGPRYYDRRNKRWVSRSAYERAKGTGRVVDTVRVHARRRVVARHARRRAEARQAEISRLAETLRERQHLSKKKARAKATRITDARAKVAKLAQTEQRRQIKEAAKVSRRRHVVEYEAKIGYTRKGKASRSERGHTSTLVNYRFRWTGYGKAPADSVVREYAYQSMRVEGYAVGREAESLGFEWAAFDWLNAKGTKTWASTRTSELRGHGELQDLTAFSLIVDEVGRDGLTIGVARDSWE